MCKRLMMRIPAVQIAGLLLALMMSGPARSQEWNAGYQHPWHLGIETGFTTIGSEEEIVHSALGSSGLNITYSILPYLNVGLTHLHLASAAVVNEQRWAWGLAPTAEIFHFPLDWLQVVGRAGLVLQHRVGADLDAVLGVTPFLSGGAGVWFSPWFSLGLDGRLYVVAGEGHLLTSRVLPQGSVVGMVSLVFTFHVGSRGPTVVRIDAEPEPEVQQPAEPPEVQQPAEPPQDLE